MQRFRDIQSPPNLFIMFASLVYYLLSVRVFGLLLKSYQIPSVFVCLGVGYGTISVQMREYQPILRGKTGKMLSLYAAHTLHTDEISFYGH